MQRKLLILLQQRDSADDRFLSYINALVTEHDKLHYWLGSCANWVFSRVKPIWIEYSESWVDIVSFALLDVEIYVSAFSSCWDRVNCDLIVTASWSSLKELGEGCIICSHAFRYMRSMVGSIDPWIIHTSVRRLWNLLQAPRGCFKKL